MISCKLRKKTAGKFKMTNGTLFKYLVLVGQFGFILCMIVNTEFM